MLFIPLNGNGQNSDAERGIRLYEQKSYTSALPYLQRAAKAGNIEVLPYLGNMYLEGLGTTVNTTAAMNMFHVYMDYLLCISKVREFKKT